MGGARAWREVDGRITECRDFFGHVKYDFALE